MPELDLSVIIVGYNTRDLLVDCLTSLAGRLGGLTAEIIVVDNASSDGSATVVRESFPEVRLLVNDTNLGFARANNQALRQARGRNLVLLNSDTVVQDDAIPRLVAYFAANPAVGAVGPALVQADGSLPVIAAGYQPTIARMLAQSFFLSRLFPRWRVARGLNLVATGRAESHEVEWLSGACLLVRREAVASAGMFSERWFMYAEDLEWCDRLRAAGWRLVYLPWVRVVHYGGASVARSPRDISTLWAASLFAHYASRTGAGPIARATFAATFGAGWLLRAGLAPFSTRRRGGTARVALRYAAFGLRYAVDSLRPARRGTRVAR